MGFSSSVTNFFRKYVSRKFLISTLVAPAIIQYGVTHGWPIEVLEKLIMLLGVGITGIAAVDTMQANRGIKTD